jgi:hypothetical protein
MVLVNYESKLREFIQAKLRREPRLSERVIEAAKTPLFESLVFRIYEYCEVTKAMTQELNIIETRQWILRK